MPSIADIIKAIESVAPVWLQESYDNSGLQIGNMEMAASGALLCTDVTDSIVDEAIAKGCNMVISHHPLLFHGLKQITGRNEQQRITVKAIKHDIAIYSSHTAMDNAWGGVSHLIASKLGISDIEVLQPQQGRLMRLVVFTPKSYASKVATALFEIGVGKYGNYDSCSFNADGIGSFRALENADPHVGKIGEMHSEPETRQEFIFDVSLKQAVENCLRRVHPYEEPAFDFIALENASRYCGSGIVGTIAPMSLTGFLTLVKERFGVHTIRYSAKDKNKTIKKVALCGGAGAFLANDAIAKGADLYLTGDLKYHDFQTYGEAIAIADMGHYESEHFTKEIFYKIITEKFPTFATYYSENEINPINYL